MGEKQRTETDGQTIKDRGLAGTIVADEQVELVGKVELSVLEATEVSQGQGADSHGRYPSPDWWMFLVEFVQGLPSR